MIKHYITKYEGDGKRLATSWIQLNLFGKAFCFNEKTIDFLKELHGKETLQYWKELIDQKNWATLVEQLLEKHYDALYRRSQNSNYVNYDQAPNYYTADLSAKGIQMLATEILKGQTSSS